MGIEPQSTASALKVLFTRPLIGQALLASVFRQAGPAGLLADLNEFDSALRSNNTLNFLDKIDPTVHSVTVC